MTVMWELTDREANWLRQRLEAIARREERGDPLKVSRQNADAAFADELLVKLLRMFA